MKTAKIARNIDEALFKLQTAQSILENHVESTDAARAVAAMMQLALGNLFCTMERLMDRGTAKKTRGGA